MVVMEKELNLINQVIQSLKSNKSSQSLISFMKDNEMIRDIYREQKNKLEKLTISLCRFAYGKAWKEFVILPPKFVE